MASRAPRDKAPDEYSRRGLFGQIGRARSQSTEQADPISADRLARSRRLRLSCVAMTQALEGTTEQDWRLSAELGVQDTAGSLHELIGRLRGGGGFAGGIEAVVPHDVVITHDGKLLFAYAAEEGTLTAARGAIEDVLRREQIDATVRISHWDDRLDEWRQTDPPLGPGKAASEAASEREAEAIETRTLVVSTGREIRAEFEQTMRNWAAKLDLECLLVEHRHLLTTQVCFTLTGPKRKIDEFADGLRAEERATIRTETTVMASPL
jgi:hypothetical protein